MPDRQLLLIAMSGVRIVNPELKALGMTLPGFIERGQVIASLPSLGLLTIAGATPPGWEIEYVEVDELDEAALSPILACPPDVAAISSLSARIDDAYLLADRLRAAGAFTVIGGLHASVLPNEALAHADSVVLGQGEWVWPQLLEDWSFGRTQRIYTGMHTPQPLDATPLPRFDLLDPTRYNRIPIQTTRGCPLDCRFCAASRLISPYKKKSLERIRAELEAVQAIWPQPFIELADDNSFVHKAWARELAALFAEHPQVRWFTETDISLGDDPELIRLLARSGCAQVLIGLESPSPAALGETDSRLWKQSRLRDAQDKVARIQDVGISVNGCFVFGFDSDTVETFDRTQEFILRLGLTEVQVTILTPFPGTKLYEDLRAEGRLHAERFWDRCTLFDVVYDPKGMTAQELESGFRRLVEQIYSPPATRARAAARTGLYRRRIRT
jgi:radical SAM superfamily enzyme YgiQ (UPF0313 family)